MRSEHVTEAPIGAIHDELPRSAQARDHLLDAVILACALVASSGGPVRAAARMSLIVETRRRGLVGSPPTRDVLALLDQQLPGMLDPRAARRQVARSMNRFVGTPWASTVVEIAAAFALANGCPAARMARALVSLRVALGLPCSEEC